MFHESTPLLPCFLSRSLFCLNSPSQIYLTGEIKERKFRKKRAQDGPEEKEEIKEQLEIGKVENEGDDDTCDGDKKYGKGMEVCDLS